MSRSPPMKQVKKRIRSFHLVFEPHAESGEKHEPAKDIDTAAVDSLNST